MHIVEPFLNVGCPESSIFVEFSKIFLKCWMDAWMPSYGQLVALGSRSYPWVYLHWFNDGRKCFIAGFENFRFLVEIATFGWEVFKFDENSK